MPDHHRIDVMIAGAQKAGTTTLAAAIERHPAIVSHETVEFPWFVAPDRFTGGFDEAFRHAFVEPTAGRTVLAKSAGVMYLPEARARLAEHNRRCRVIVILRNPVDRAWSAYWYQRRTGTEDAPTFEEALAREPDRLASDLQANRQLAYLDRGDYLTQIEGLEALFGDLVTVLLMDDLIEDQRGTVEQALRAVGLDSSALPPDVATITEHGAADARSHRVAKALRQPGTAMRVAGRLVPARVRERVKHGLIAANERALAVEPMSNATRARLVEHFAARNDALGRHLGRDLSHWSA